MPQAGDGRSPIMALGPDKKLGLLRDTSLQPFRLKEETFEIPVPRGINEITVAVRLTYQPRPGNSYSLHTLSRKVRGGGMPRSFFPLPIFTPIDTI